VLVRQVDRHVWSDLPASISIVGSWLSSARSSEAPAHGVLGVTMNARIEFLLRVIIVRGPEILDVAVIGSWRFRLLVAEAEICFIEIRVPRNVGCGRSGLPSTL
jgi:hypothetical protein